MSTITPSAAFTVNDDATLQGLTEFAAKANNNIMLGTRDADRNIVLYFADESSGSFVDKSSGSSADESSGSVDSRPKDFRNARLKMRAKAARDGLLEIAKNTIKGNASCAEKMIASGIYSKKSSLPETIERDEFLMFVREINKMVEELPSWAEPQTPGGSSASHVNDHRKSESRREFDGQLRTLRDKNVNNRSSSVLADGKNGSNEEKGQAVAKPSTFESKKNESPQPETGEITATNGNRRHAVNDLGTTQGNYKAEEVRPRGYAFQLGQVSAKPVDESSTPKDPDSPSDKLDFNELMKGPGIGALISGAVSKVFSSVSGLVSSFVDFLSRLTAKSKSTLEDEKYPAAGMTIKVPGLEGTKTGDVTQLMYQNNKILEFLRTEKGQAALAQEGAFRIPGENNAVNELRKKKIIDFSKYEHKSNFINDLASLFKRNASEIAKSKKFRNEIENFKEVVKSSSDVDHNSVPETMLPVFEVVKLLLPHKKVTRMAGSQIIPMISSSLWGDPPLTENLVKETVEDHKLTGKLLQALVKDFNPLEK